MQHVIVYAEPDRFAGWPANNGVWIWGDEILVGFTTGGYSVSTSHNIEKPYQSLLARSLDGGLSWQIETPTNFVGIGKPLSPVTTKINFAHPDFAMRVEGCAYHGSKNPHGGFYCSYDRGKTWQGPFQFNGLSALSQFTGADMTPRTDYLVIGQDACLVFLSARSNEQWGADRTFCARTNDGGRSFDFVSWVVPPDDPYRAVMPNTVYCSSTKLISALRRRDMENTQGDCWIDAYASFDTGQTWSFLSRIGETGGYNGNPPALVRLKDGHLCCVYGNRNQRQLIARYSQNEGATWGKEYILRDDYHSGLDDQDFGYPRLVQRTDGCLVTIYYWASQEHPQQHITATIWEP